MALNSATIRGIMDGTGDEAMCPVATAAHLGTLTKYLDAATGLYSGTLDLNGLTGAVLDVTADSIPFIDATGNVSVKESVDDLVTALAGAGIANVASQLAVSADAITDAMISSQIVDDEGQATVGYFYLTGAVSDAESVVIDGRDYEFDNNASITGDMTVTVTDLTADAAIAALVLAINSDGNSGVAAVAWPSNDDTSAGCSLVEESVGAAALTLATDAANGVVSAANTTGHRAAATKQLMMGSYTVTAADVTTWALAGGDTVVIAGLPTASAPTLVSFRAVTSAGALVVLPATVVFTIVQSYGPTDGYYVLQVDDGAATFTAGDVITWSAWV